MAQISIMARRCVICKNHVASLKVKVTLGIRTLCMCYSDLPSCLTHNFVLHGGVLKLYGTKAHLDRMIAGTMLLA